MSMPSGPRDASQTLYAMAAQAKWRSRCRHQPAEVFSDNTKSWSGDHCIDPREVPGVMFCDRKINTETPDLMDMAPTALQLFGCELPKYLQGQPLFGDRKPDNVVSVEQKLEGLLDFGSGDEGGASSQGEALMRESGWLPRFDRSYRGILAKFGL